LGNIHYWLDCAHESLGQKPQAKEHWLRAATFKGDFQEKQESLGTEDRAEATSLLNARNEAARQPQLNLQIAEAYLAGTDSGVSTRTWQTPSTPSLNPRAVNQGPLAARCQEDPDIILRKQLDKVKDQKMVEVKMEGIEYDQRMEELEKLEHPKPNPICVFHLQ